MAETVRDFRRGQIIAAARGIVAEQGLEALTIGALEERLRFSRGVITYHFENKEEILHAVLTSAVEEIDAAVRGETTPGISFEDRVRAILRVHVMGFVDRAEATLVLLSFWGRLGSDSRARDTNAKLYARYRRRAAKILKEARDVGFAPTIDVEGMAALMVGIVIGLATQVHFDRGPEGIDLERAIEESCSTVLARLREKSA